MATPWTFEEDYMVCDFYLNHLNDWQQHLDELMETLKERRFNRDKGTVRMRIQNFQYLQTGGSNGLKNGAKQSELIHQTFIRHSANPALKENISAHIKSTYIGTVTGNNTVRFEEDQLLPPLDYSLLTATQQTLHKMVFTFPQAPTFKDILFEFINKKGFKKPSEVYSACFVKRDTFHAIKTCKNMGVSRRTVMQLCFGLKLTYDEAVVLMASAGYAFASNNLTDVIVEYYLKHQIYDIVDANISLYDSGADLLF